MDVRQTYTLFKNQPDQEKQENIWSEHGISSTHEIPHLIAMCQTSKMSYYVYALSLVRSEVLGRGDEVPRVLNFSATSRSSCGTDWKGFSPLWTQ